MKIQDRLKAGSVKRWNIVETTRQQTLAEHMFNVAMIAGEIAKLCPTVPVHTVYAWAIQHDLEEVILGDIPTPTKAKMLELGFDYKKLSDAVWDKPNVDSSIRKIVKMADRMEALWFIQEHGIGRHAQLVEKRMRETFNESLNGQQTHSTLKAAAEEVWASIVRGDIEI